MCLRLGPTRLWRQSSKVSGDRRSLPAFSSGIGSSLTMEEADPDICVPHVDEHHVLTMALRSGAGAFALPRRSERKNRAVFNPPAPSPWRGTERGSATAEAIAKAPSVRRWHSQCSVVGTHRSAPIQRGSSLASASRNAGQDPCRHRDSAIDRCGQRRRVSSVGNVRHRHFFGWLVRVAGQQDRARSL